MEGGGVHLLNSRLLHGGDVEDKFGAIGGGSSRERMLARKPFITDHNTQSVQIKECVKKQQHFCFNHAGLHS